MIDVYVDVDVEVYGGSLNRGLGLEGRSRGNPYKNYIAVQF